MKRFVPRYRKPKSCVQQRWTLILLLSFLSLSIAHAQATKPTRWESTIQRFEAQDAKNPPPKGEILFVGSSSVRMWPLAKSFPDLKVIGRGFGGSQFSDVLDYVDRIVLPYAPRTIVVYEGDNDVAKGKSAERVYADWKKFVGTVHRHLPRTKICFVAIKPSLARWNLAPTMRDANARIQKSCERDERLVYLDIDTPMIGDDGKPKKELFVKDGLHMSWAGYQIWNAVVRPHLGPQKAAAKGELFLATCQFPVSGDVRANSKWIQKQMREAKDRGADVVHFSEAALGGYPGVDYDPKAQKLDWSVLDAEFRAVRGLAKKLKLWVVLGSDHRLSAGNKPHNSLYVIHPKGEIVDRYDKRFCTGGDLRNYSPGSHFATVDIQGVRCGFLICYDVRFPELYREYHRRGVQLMFHSFHNARQKPGSIHPTIMPISIQTRAATNYMYVSANNSSAPRSWPSIFVTPDGLIRQRLSTDKPGVMLERVRTKDRFYDASRPYRKGSIEGKWHSGELVDDPRSKNRTSP
ncbi:MAG: nitrilase-related carbon-nitrogen hydrolase [Planctomycetota bacterium]